MSVEERPSRLSFAAAGGALAIMLIGSSLPTPLFPVYGQLFHFGSLGITLLFSAYTLLVIPALVLIGPLSDAKGRREVLVAALGISVVYAALFAAANQRAWLFVGQGIEAVAMGALQGTGAHTLVESDPRQDRRRASAVASAVTMGGAAAGLLLAGALAEYGPLSRRLPYLVEIVLLIGALVAVVTFVPPRRNRNPWRPRRPTIPPHIRRPFLVASTSAFVAWAVGGLYLALVPSFVWTALHHRNLLVSGAIVALMMGTSAAAQLVAQRLPSRPVQQAGVVIMGLSVAVIAVTTHYPALAPLLIASVLAGVGHGLAFMGSLGDVSEIAPHDRKADVVASYYVVVYFSTALPVIGVGVLAGSMGLLPAVSLFAYVVFAVCVLGLVGLVAETPDRRAAAA
jgi:MFS family permease